MCPTRTPSRDLWTPTTRAVVPLASSTLRPGFRPSRSLPHAGRTDRWGCRRVRVTGGSGSTLSSRTAQVLVCRRRCFVSCTRSTRPRWDRLVYRPTPAHHHGPLGRQGSQDEQGRDGGPHLLEGFLVERRVPRGPHEPHRRCRPLRHPHVVRRHPVTQIDLPVPVASHPTRLEVGADVSLPPPPVNTPSRSRQSL